MLRAHFLSLNPEHKKTRQCASLRGRPGLLLLILAQALEDLVAILLNGSPLHPASPSTFGCLAAAIDPESVGNPFGPFETLSILTPAAATARTYTRTRFMCMFMLILPIEGEWCFDVGLQAQIVRQHDGITAMTQYRICHPRRHNHSEACRFTLSRPTLLVKQLAARLPYTGFTGMRRTVFRRSGATRRGSER